MKKIVSLFLFVVIATVTTVVAQERKITGTVTSAEDGQPLPGVNVMLKGTVKAAVTDARGKYQINVPATSGTLVFSFIGLVTQEVPIEMQSVIDVALATDVQSLTEVVVTSGLLQGKVAGAQISSKSHGRSGPKKEKKTMADGYLQPEPTQQPQWDTEEYEGVAENVFHDALRNPLSTFSIDVDAASYSNLRRFLNNGQRPPRDAVRIEEMINYFDYDYQQPQREDPFSIYTEVAPAPWNEKHKLVHIGLQGKKIATDNLPPSNLVFLVDVSGSMEDANKLPLLKASFKLLVEQLRDQDRVAIVVYAGAAGLVLPSTPGSSKKRIITALDELQAGGSTAGGAGIRLAYRIARENFREGGNNRVILATDGDFNIGESSNAAMEDLIEEKRKDGVFLTVLGFGMGNYKDSKMETLADKGNGNYAYIDNILEAQKVLVNEFGGTLFTIAKDVKLQIEFNPALVKAYRLIGYENRMLQHEDFNNDKKDAGDLGSGHTVTALYEIIPTGVDSEFYKVDELKYQKPSVNTGAQKSKELLTVKFRYKKPDADVSKLIVQTVEESGRNTVAASENFRWSAAVAAFGMHLRESEYLNGFSIDDILKLAKEAKGEDREGYRAEFIKLVKTEVLTANR